MQLPLKYLAVSSPNSSTAYSITSPSVQSLISGSYGGQEGSPTKGTCQGNRQRSRLAIALAAATFANHVIVHKGALHVVVL